MEKELSLIAKMMGNFELSPPPCFQFSSFEPDRGLKHDRANPRGPLFCLPDRAGEKKGKIYFGSNFCANTATEKPTSGTNFHLKKLNSQGFRSLSKHGWFVTIVQVLLYGTGVHNEQTSYTIIVLGGEGSKMEARIICWPLLFCLAIVVYFETHWIINTAKEQIFFTYASRSFFS